MPKNVQLLLVESVENLGIVGDVVKVRTGYARNYLLPRQLATTPSEELISSLSAKRAEAERQLAEQRKMREDIVQKLDAGEFTIARPCNDMGVLYGAVTQQDIATMLAEHGHGVRPRDVRLPQAIKRVDKYEVHIRFEADLEAVIKLDVQPDRQIVEDAREEMEFDDEGNLVRPGSRRARGRDRDRDRDRGDAAPAEKAPAAAAAAKDAPKSDDADKSSKAKKSKAKEPAAEGKKGKSKA